MVSKLVGVVLDAGALILAEKNDRRFWTFWKKSLQQGLDVTVPAPVLAQSWRGGKNVRMALVLKSCSIEPLSEKTAKSVGELCAKANSNDIIDASVVLAASEKHYAVLTSDAGDIGALAALFPKSPRVLDLSKLDP